MQINGGYVQKFFLATEQELTSNSNDLISHNNLQEEPSMLKDQPFYNLSVADNQVLIKEGNDKMQRNINSIGIIKQTKQLLNRELK